MLDYKFRRKIIFAKLNTDRIAAPEINGLAECSIVANKSIIKEIITINYLLPLLTYYCLLFIIHNIATI